MIRVLELRSVRGTGGGPEKTILLGARQHDSRRFAVTVCYIRDERDEVFGIDERARRAEVDYVEIRERHSFDRSIWRQLLDVIAARRIDIIHGHDYKTNLLALLLARRSGAVAIGTAHGWTGQSARERYVYYPAERRLLARFPKVIAVSSDVRNELVRAGADPACVDVILNGIDPDMFQRTTERRDATRRALGLTDRHIVVGAIGRLEQQKRFDLLMEACARLRADHPDLVLTIVGDGSLMDDLSWVNARLGLGDACRMLGHRLDVADLHCAFDLFVQSSDYEGTPNSVLEAMAMETPIVATDAGGTRELAEPDVHGIIVPCGDVPALENGIRSILRDPAAARLRVAAARARVEDELSFAMRTRRLEQVYDQLMANRDHSREPARADAVRVPHA
jgi:glycosyltransferase involved in cell wall biosynthesis